MGCGWVRHSCVRFHVVCVIVAVWVVVTVAKAVVASLVDVYYIRLTVYHFLFEGWVASDAGACVCVSVTPWCCVLHCC